MQISNGIYLPKNALNHVVLRVLDMIVYAHSINDMIWRQILVLINVRSSNVMIKLLIRVAMVAQHQQAAITGITIAMCA